MPLAELGRECAILAYVAGAEVRVNLKESLLHISIAQMWFEFIPFPEEEPGGALNAMGNAALLYP